jgi:hypothetical protein
MKTRLIARTHRAMQTFSVHGVRVTLASVVVVNGEETDGLYDSSDDSAVIRIGETLADTVATAFACGMKAGAGPETEDDEEQDAEPFDGLGRG